MSTFQQIVDSIQASSHAVIPPAILQEFTRRLAAGNYTRDENPASHFCVYFAAFDPGRGQVFVGHHKKSGLWLFNGGHIDPGETALEAVKREIGEEWGLWVPEEQIGSPQLLTVTEIEDQPAIQCDRHYDIWYLIACDRAAFTPDPARLAEEFHQTEWLTPAAARTRITCPNNLQALSLIEQQFHL
jgi:8-oxo-dGTP pyrophosphatase MutT (NUDIX family)